MPQEAVQDPDGLAAISSPQVSRRGRRNAGDYSNGSAFCYLLLVSQSHPSSSPALATPSFASRKPILLSFHVKPQESGRRLSSHVCLAPPVPSSVPLRDRAVELVHGWVSRFTSSSSALRKSIGVGLTFALVNVRSLWQW